MFRNKWSLPVYFQIRYLKRYIYSLVFILNKLTIITRMIIMIVQLFCLENFYIIKNKIDEERSHNMFIIMIIHGYEV